MGEALQANNRYFKSMLAEGRITELRIHEYFRRKGYDIADRSNDPISQSIGVDFEFYNIKKRAIFRVEVKDDSRIHATGNIFIEHKMVRSTKTAKGWLHYCLADYLCYHDSMQDIGYLIKWPELREQAAEFPLRKFRNPYDMDTMGYGHIVPLKEVKERGLIAFTYDLSGIEVPKE